MNKVFYIYRHILSLYELENNYLGTLRLGLLLAAPLLELHFTDVHNGSGDSVNVVLLLLVETKGVESNLVEKMLS